MEEEKKVYEGEVVDNDGQAPFEDKEDATEMVFTSGGWHSLPWYKKALIIIIPCAIIAVLLAVALKILDVMIRIAVPVLVIIIIINVIKYLANRRD